MKERKKTRDGEGAYLVPVIHAVMYVYSVNIETLYTTTRICSGLCCFLSSSCKYPLFFRVFAFPCWQRSKMNGGRRGGSKMRIPRPLSRLGARGGGDGRPGARFVQPHIIRERILIWDRTYRRCVVPRHITLVRVYHTPIPVIPNRRTYSRSSDLFD